MKSKGTVNTSNINNSIYQFDISIVNTAKDREMRLPIPKGAIEYMEIEDNLANFGLVGKCRIANFYGILQQLNILDSTEVQHMFIDIVNTDFKNSEADNNPDVRLTLFATLQQGVEASQNVISKSVNYKFEEYFVAQMRKQTIIPLLENSEISTKNTPGNLIYNILTALNKESTLGLSKQANFNNEFMLDDELPYEIALSELYTGNKVASVFDVVSDLYNFVTFRSNDIANIGGGPAIISSVNKLVDGVVKRFFTLQPLSHFTTGLYDKLQQKAEDLSDYVMEEFIVGDAPVSNTLNTNFIDNYALLTTNYDDVMANKWIDYTLSEIKTYDPTVVRIEDITYESLRADFSKEMLNGVKPNLPDRSSEDQIMTAQIKKKVADDDLSKLYTQNAVKKSFVFDNIALTFTVPGNTYRKTGKFIRIKPPTTLKSKNGDIESKSIDGYWLVILLKHVFDGDYYTNEFTCVRLHTGDPTYQTSLTDMFNAIRDDGSNSPLLDNFKATPDPEPIAQIVNQGRLNNAVSTTAAPDNNGIIRPPLDTPAPNVNSNRTVLPATEKVDPTSVLDYINKK
jgi:hypothetical protein